MNRFITCTSTDCWGCLQRSITNGVQPIPAGTNKNVLKCSQARWPKSLEIRLLHPVLKLHHYNLIVRYQMFERLLTVTSRAGYEEIFTALIVDTGTIQPSLGWPRFESVHFSLSSVNFKIQTRSNSTLSSQAGTHPSYGLAQCSLTLVIISL